MPHSKHEFLGELKLVLFYQTKLTHKKKMFEPFIPLKSILPSYF